MLPDNGRGVKDGGRKRRNRESAGQEQAGRQGNRFFSVPDSISILVLPVFSPFSRSGPAVSAFLPCLSFSVSLLPLRRPLRSGTPAERTPGPCRRFRFALHPAGRSSRGQRTGLVFGALGRETRPVHGAFVCPDTSLRSHFCLEFLQHETEGAALEPATRERGRARPGECFP